MRRILSVFCVVVALTTVIACGEKKEANAPTKLLWWTIGPSGRDQDKVIGKLNEYLREKINVEVEIKYADWGEYTEKMSKIINTGEDYDICFTSSWANNFVFNAKNGAFYALNDLLAQTDKQLVNYIPQALWNSAKVGKTIYAVPTYKDTVWAPYWAFNENDLKALNLNADDYQWKPGEKSSVPSMKRLETAFKAYKDAYPDKYPLYLDKAGYPGIFDEFDMVVGGNDIPIGIAFDDESGKIICPLETSIVKEKWGLLNKWMKIGYINQDALSLDETPKVLFLFLGHGFPYADVSAWSGHYPCKAVLRYEPFFTTGSTQGSLNAISAQSRHPEKALQLLTLANLDPYVRNMLAYGIEGVHYKKTGETSIEFIDRKGYDVPSFSQATFFTMYTVDPAPPQMWNAVKDFSAKALPSPLSGFTFDPTPVETDLAILKAAYDKYKLFIMLGYRTYDEVYPEMMAALEAAGLRKIMAEAQSQVDAWKASR